MSTPIKEIRLLVQWMLDENDRFDDIRTSYGDDPEDCKHVDDVENALYLVSDWLEEVSPDYATQRKAERLERLGRDLDYYMYFRAKREGVKYKLTPEFFVGGILEGCRKFFGVEIGPDADGVLAILGDEQQPDMLREWLDREAAA
jgi:hypothetical protein